jgi:hypothetical protein
MRYNQLVKLLSTTNKGIMRGTKDPTIKEDFFFIKDLNKPIIGGIIKSF